MRKYFKKFLGVVLIILGFLALITPCSPGSWLILVGLELLGLRFLLEDKMPFLKTFYKGKFGNMFKKSKPKKIKQINPNKGKNIKGNA